MNLTSMLWLLGGTVLPSLVVAWLAALVIRRQAASWGLVDHPADRKVHTTPTPLGGGVAIWLGIIFPFLVGQIILWLATSNVGSASKLAETLIPAFALPHLEGLLKQSYSLWILLGAGTVLMVVGLIDDRWGLSWQKRMLIQFGMATFCVASQGWGLTAFLEMPWITGFISVVWIVGMINSFNMLDNMDGLSAGVATIAAGMLAAVLLLAPNPQTNHPQLFVAGLLLVIVGALLGFLIHNRPPAKIFMGDAGSYFVGFCISVATLLATYASYRSTSQHTILAPLCVMAVPLYDMISVLWIRIRQGRSIFQADKCHLSHRLVDLGLSKGQAVLTIYLLTATCGLGALLLHQVNTLGAMIIILMVLFILALIAILESTAHRKINQE